MKKPAPQKSGAKSKKRGGSAYVVTDAARRKVKSLRKTGLTETEIAGALGITKPTLIKYFAAELAFVPTAAQRRKVSIAAGGGMSQRDIALALGIPVTRLRKHFAHELTAGALERRVEVLEAMHSAGKKGNVSAQRAYLSTMLAMDEERRGSQQSKANPGAPTKGKKEQAAAAAQTATVGSDWDDLLAPDGAVLQ